MISFIPASMLANKIGRKNTVLTGLGLIIVAAIACAFFTKINVVFLLLIAVCGIGWAMINCNSYPMVVELASKNSIGKYTGYYYTASMLAQTITPVFVGLLFYFVSSGYKILFPYAAIAMAVATALFVTTRMKKQK
jgi:MFS family permease